MSQQTSTVLIIHNAPRVGKLWSLGLLSQGMQVVPETSTDDLTNTISQLSPDCIIFDSTITSLSAFEFSRSCNQQFPRIPIVIAAPEGREINPVEIRWAMQQGAADMLATPQKLSELGAVVQRIMKLSGNLSPFDAKALQASLMKKTTAANVQQVTGLEMPVTPKTQPEVEEPELAITAEASTVAEDPAPPVDVTPAKTAEPAPAAARKPRMYYRGRPVY